LAHHQNGSLYSGQTRQHQIQQNIGVRIKGAGCHDGIEDHPPQQQYHKGKQKKPTAGKGSQFICGALSKCLVLHGWVLGYFFMQDTMDEGIVVQIVPYVLQNTLSAS